MAFLSGMCSRVASCTIAEARSLGNFLIIILVKAVKFLNIVTNLTTDVV